MYPVTTIFRSLQGEGHFVGCPMAFIRLAGCSVRACHIRSECDEAPWKATERLSAGEIAQRCVELSPGGIACITGGEPADHDLIPLVDELRSAGIRIHVETSGTRELPGLPVEWLTVSPKTFDYVQRVGNVLKVVVRPGWTWREIAILDDQTTFFHRYLQPMTSPNGSTNLRDVVEMLLASKSDRWMLSTQAHRTWSVK